MIPVAPSPPSVGWSVDVVDNGDTLGTLEPKGRSLEPGQS